MTLYMHMYIIDTGQTFEKLFTTRFILTMQSHNSNLLIEVFFYQKKKLSPQLFFAANKLSVSVYNVGKCTYAVERTLFLGGEIFCVSDLSL